MQQLRALPLAPKPLCSPHPYDSAYQVQVQLDEPLWVPKAGPQEVAMEIMALCIQLDSLILTSTQNRDQESPEGSSSGGGGKRVTFQRTLASKASAVMTQMRELLRRADMADDIEAYLRESGINYLFPRVELYIQEPDQELRGVASPIMEGYFTHVSSLNNLLTMAQQLNTDVQTCASHKYIAHQTALLYQCVSHMGTPFAHYKKEIEGQFTAIKTACTSQPGGHPPRLTPELQKWVIGMTQKLVNEVVSLQPELLPPLTHILTTIHNIPTH